MTDQKPRLTVEKAPDVSEPPQDAPSGRHEPSPVTKAPEVEEQESPARLCRRVAAWTHDVVVGHENAALGGAVGLAVALLIFAIGFWRALFVALCVCVGVVVGQFLDGDARVVRAIRKLFSDNR
ncbi:DUF2273 domain-containing protein [Olsenella sp. HMSC062G07]|uniref:DUF2273 domain-containing protein n=1 Tax=Olsenella sp. HMSC062G07 TaxID=1739330 RepID=UPI0009F21634|nr:DUF2273 domain-containing protein [Olsenella sp. HMSC062G07]